MVQPLSDSDIENLKNEIKKLAAVPQEVFQFDLNRDSAEHFLKSNPKIPFIVRKARIEGYFALSQNTGFHLLIEPPLQENEAYKLYRLHLGVKTEIATLDDYLKQLIRIRQRELERWERLRHNIQLIRQKAVLSIQTLDNQKAALSATELHDFAQKNPGLEQFGNGHTGFAIAKVLHAPFVVARSPGNRDLANQKFKNHLINNSLLVITGHGSPGGAYISGAYINLTAKEEAEIAQFETQIKRGPDLIVSSCLEAGLKNGDQITVLLCVCYGATDPHKNHQSFAHKLLREFASHGVSATVIASNRPVGRFGTNAIEDDQITFKTGTGMDPESIRIFTTEVTAPDNDPTIDVYEPNETIVLSKKGLVFRDTTQTGLTSEPIAMSNHPIPVHQPLQLPAQPPTPLPKARGSISINEELMFQKGESAEEQAKRIFADIKNQLETNPDKKIALLYSANNGQALLFHEVYAKNQAEEILPRIDGSGQAQLFRSLIPLINQHPSVSKRIRVLPIATSLYGGENGPGNIVSHEMIQRDLDAIQKHLKEGYDVQGIPNEKGGYAIGGLASKHWFTKEFAAMEHRGRNLSQGDYVQMQLNFLEQNIDHLIRVPPVQTGVLKEELHYEHATFSKGRKHFFDVSENKIIALSLRGLKGDVIKTKILADFRQAAENAPDRDSLNQIIEQFKKGELYKILATGQGLVTRLFHLKTDSIKAFEKIVEDLKKQTPGHSR